MKKTIIANWKMQPHSPKRAIFLAHGIERGLKNIKNIEVVLAPPFIFLPMISNVKHSASMLKFGAQDIFWGKSGAYTGEISTQQLKACGARMVIVGHSERRELGDTNEIVNKKLRAALEAGLKAVLCVGEKEKEKDVAFPAIIRKELYSGLARIKKSMLKKLLIAYEPIWAISTSKNSVPNNPKNVYEMSLLIKRELYRMLGKNIASNIPVLYGGSVDDKNAARFVREGAVDGLLVGGASLNAKKFVKIVREVSRI